MLCLERRVGNLLQYIEIVTKSISDKDVIIRDIDLSLCVGIDVARDNSQNLRQCPGHSLTKLILFEQIDGGPNLCLLLVVVFVA